MLKPVFARAGSDKAEYIINQIKQNISASDRKTMLVVPEQSSFETEKELYLSLGDKDFSRIEVVSFTRLSRLINERYGMVSKKRLSSAGKLILASRAIENAIPDLKVYSKQTSSSAFTQKISSVIDELKAAGISADDFEKRLTQIEINKSLNNKLSDLSSIYNFYDAFLKDEFIDPSDELNETNKKLSDGEFFKDFDVIIDEFVSFNLSQREIMAKMLLNSPSVTLILCSAPSKRGISAACFKTPNDTFEKIKLLCSRNSIDICTPVVLEAGKLFENEDLKNLEAYLSGEQKDRIESDNIKIFSAPSKKKECRFVAAEIRRLVKEEGYRYKDIAVIGREIEDYLYDLEDSFRLYDISFFADMRAGLDTRPVVVFILSLLQTLISDMSSSDFISYLKCGISPVSIDEAALLENYIELWKISKKELTCDFNKNPEGFDGEMTDKSLEDLKQLNEIREKVVVPLVKLKKEILSATGDEITRSIYRFMKQNGVLKKLSEYVTLISETDNAIASEEHRAFEICMGIMNQLHNLLKGQKVTLKRYLELFRLGLLAEDVGSIPHHLDEVLVGDAGRVRLNSVKVVFLVGVTDGVFPKRHTEDGFFTDNDRKIIRQNDIDILTPSLVMNQNEKFYLYNALTSATRRVYLSYPLSSRDGEQLFESHIICDLREKLGVKEFSVNKEPIETFLATNEAAFETLCLNYNKNTSLANSLREYFMLLPQDEYRLRLVSIDKGLRLRNSAIDETVASKLYKNRMLISPSQMEKYHLCRFSHFCRYGLSLKPPKSTEITVLNTGSAIHEVLEKLLKKYTKQQLAEFSDDKLSKLAEDILEEFISTKIGTEAEVDSRSRYSVLRLKSTIVPVIRYIVKELEHSGFVPTDFELEIQKNSDIEPYSIKSENGNTVGLYGKIDRVDIKKEDDKTFVRVIDYKSGGKKFKKEEIDYGINLQMLSYLFSIWENGDKRYGENITPSGVLYMPAKRDYVESKGGDVTDAVLKKQFDGFKMNGLVLDDSATKKEDDKSFLSVGYSDISEFSYIKSKTEKLLCSMADSLRSGQLSINPLYSGKDNLACVFCDYKMICGYEEGDFCRKVNEGEGENLG